GVAEQYAGEPAPGDGAEDEQVDRVPADVLQDGVVSQAVAVGEVEFDRHARAVGSVPLQLGGHGFRGGSADTAVVAEGRGVGEPRGPVAVQRVVDDIEQVEGGARQLRHQQAAAQGAVGDGAEVAGD